MSTESDSIVMSIEDTAFQDPGPAAPHPPATVFGTAEELSPTELARRVEQHAQGMRKPA